MLSAFERATLCPATPGADNAHSHEGGGRLPLQDSGSLCSVVQGLSWLKMRQVKGKSHRPHSPVSWTGQGCPLGLAALARAPETAALAF